MKKPSRLHLALLFFPTFFLLFSSCKKINEATLLGGGLVPEVDNINTFDTVFSTQTNNVLLTDTGVLKFDDAVALGTISNDPEFGQTAASVYFQVLPPAYGKSPFSGTIKEIDSVILSLDYVAGYGDTDQMQTVHVYQIAPQPAFNDSTYYTFNHADFATTGSELGSATFSIRHLHDSLPLVFKDTTIKVANQLRIRLDNSFGQLLAAYDSASAYGNDTLFKEKLRGLALKPEAGMGNGLAYFSLSNADVTRLTVYYKAISSTGKDTTSVSFRHGIRLITATKASKGGQANIIRRQPGGNWNNYLQNDQPQDDKLYIQSAPGSAGYITIPGLETFSNKLVHRAELIVTTVPSELSSIFTATKQLFLDRIKPGSDSAFIFPEFLVASGNTLAFNYGSYGGKLQTGDGTYRFNITKEVQDVLAGRLQAPVFRLYAPFDSNPLDPNQTPPVPVSVKAIPYPAYGRVVVGGGNFAEAGKQLRLRVVYSKL